MTTQTIDQTQVTPTHVSADEYMEHYAHLRYEWVNEELIKLSPIMPKHDDLTDYLRDLIKTYFAFNPIGFTRGGGIVLILKTVSSRRIPDLQVILKDNPHYTPNGMNGPADIVIEVVSQESTARDYNDKFVEYLLGGVREYWILDYLIQETRFFRLNDDHRYELQPLDQNGNYRTPLLPKFVLHIPTSWSDDFPPDMLTIMETVRAMFTEPTPNDADE